MVKIMRHLQPVTVILVTFIFICMMASCHDVAHRTASQVNTPEDSASLRVAILPIEECQPLVYALDSGIAKRMGLDMILVQYDATMDMDTAVLSDVAHVYFLDSMRVANIRMDSLRPHLLLPIPAKMSLLVNKDKKLDDVAALTTHMVGVTRHSTLERWMNHLTEQAGCELDMIYHAQINSIPVRFNMLRGGLIDAAVISRPWSDSLASLGHKVLKEEVLDGMGFYVGANVDSIRRRQTELLKKVYVEALSQMNNTENK